MQLSEIGESRVHGYLFVLERSLSTFLPTADALDAAREVESHIRERLDETEALPDERTAIERVLGELGPPLRVARAYSVEMSATEAVTTGRVIAVARALWHMAALGVGWFFSTLALFTGYAFGASFLAIAILKPIFPDHVGLFIIDGVPRSFGATTNLPPGTVVAGGYWIIPICAVLGLAILVGTHITARRLLESWLTRRREQKALAG